MKNLPAKRPIPDQGALNAAAKWAGLGLKFEDQAFQTSAEGSSIKRCMP
jgi:hypothetical protein